jgi:hypothetical protein
MTGEDRDATEAQVGALLQAEDISEVRCNGGEG